MGHIQAATTTSGAPEYTILTPVTPIRTGQMSGVEQTQVPLTATTIHDDDSNATSAHPNQRHQQLHDQHHLQQQEQQQQQHHHQQQQQLADDDHLHRRHQNSGTANLMVHVKTEDGNAREPECTILTPVSPISTSHMSGPEQNENQISHRQQSANTTSSSSLAPQPTTTTSTPTTILTHSDAISAQANQQQQDDHLHQQHQHQGEAANLKGNMQAPNSNTNGTPEYTILTPATPMRSSQMSGDEQSQIPHTPTTTILTDLDAASEQSQQQHQHHHHLHHQQQQQQQQDEHLQQQPHDNQQHPQLTTSPARNDTQTQDGSQQHYQGSGVVPNEQNDPSSSPLPATIKIEPLQQHPGSNSSIGSSHALLTELTPAAVGTTLCELTKVSVHNQQDHLGSSDNHQQSQFSNEDQNQLDLQHHHHMVVSDNQHPELVPVHNQQSLVSLQAPISTNADPTRPLQTNADLLVQAAPDNLTIIGTSNASNSSLCSSASNGASTTGAGRATETPTSLASSTAVSGSTGTGNPPATGGGGKRRTWNQVNRNSNKIEIPKLYSQYGFRCYLETPISTCRRKEEDRITYINKGEFYGLTLEYVPDPQKPLRSAIVKTVVMLVFREDKSPEEDLKSWQFWHGRQHSAKQRILDADNKNHVNVINQIEEVSLNAIAFYWNPTDTRTAKLNVAIQCLSTDFSNQKGVKGLPLNLQVDIYDFFTETSTPVYRGYATLLSYCDKGAQRRSRDEERRAMKRKLTDNSVSSLTTTGAAKKFDDLYHKPCDRSEFYSMADLIRTPTLYSPSEDALMDVAKQPMSQSSGVSITPISATTPIPSIENMQYNTQTNTVIVTQRQPQSQQQQQQHQQQASQNTQAGQLAATVISNTQSGGRLAPHSSYSIISSTDYLQHPQTLVNTTGIGGPTTTQTVLAGNAQQPQQSLHGMVTMANQQQQPQQSHLVQQQISQQSNHSLSQQQQQQHHHYHPMATTPLQASYGVMQTDHHQAQQYAILQAPPSIAMVQPHHHHQQQMIGSNVGQQQHQQQQSHQAPLMDSRGQQHQPLMMTQQTGMISQTTQAQLQQSSQQQQQQQQQQMQQMHQYQQPIVGITTASIPISQAPFAKRAKLYPDERVLIYAKQADEKDFYPLHLSPPSLSGLVYAIEQKYKIDSTKVANIYKKSKKGIRVQMDDEMIRHYCNEDMVQLEVIQTSDSRLEITLVEL